MQAGSQRTAPMAWQVIHKSKHTSSTPPLLADYESARREFRWADARALLSAERPALNFLQLLSATATVTITITPVNDTPTFTVQEPGFILLGTTGPQTATVATAAVGLAHVLGGTRLLAGGAGDPLPGLAEDELGVARAVEAVRAGGAPLVNQADRPQESQQQQADATEPDPQRAAEGHGLEVRQPFTLPDPVGDGVHGPLHREDPLRATRPLV